MSWYMLFFFTDTAPTEIYTLSLHDALPISAEGIATVARETGVPVIFGVLTVDSMEQALARCGGKEGHKGEESARARSEEHTSELQSLRHLVCRLLLEKKKKTKEDLQGIKTQ